jgi:hypothetical protein
MARERRKPTTFTESNGSGTKPVARGKMSWEVLFGEIQKLPMGTWDDLVSWGKETGNLEPWQQTLCFNFRAKLEKGKKLKTPECDAMLDMLDAACEKGFQP